MEKITRLNRTNSDKQGNALMNKQGRPYTRLSLQLESKDGIWASGFDSAISKDWKIGDSVDIILSTVEKDDKTYLNWSLPKAAAANNTEVMEMLTRILLSLGALRNDVAIIKDKVVVPYPKSTGPTAFDDGVSETEMGEVDDSSPF